MIGEVSHFRVLERVGEGGMGVIYRAEDTALKRAAALKFITQKHATDKLQESDSCVKRRQGWVRFRMLVLSGLIEFVRVS